VDRDAGLLEIARREHGTFPNLRFENGDACSLSYHAQFDIVTAARTLQWIAEPGLAISKMRQAAKPSGLLVVLDYNHARNGWKPDPPTEFSHFYGAFLAWRQANQWDNEIADRLPELFGAEGLVAIESYVQDEVAERGETDFAERAALWSEVIENVGEQVATAGLCTESQLREAQNCYASWVRTALVRQTLTMRAVKGTVPYTWAARPRYSTPSRPFIPNIA